MTMTVTIPVPNYDYDHNPDPIHYYITSHTPTTATTLIPTTTR